MNLDTDKGRAMCLNIEQERREFEADYIARCGLRIEDYCLEYDTETKQYQDDCEQSAWEGWISAKCSILKSIETGGTKVVATFAQVQRFMKNSLKPEEISGVQRVDRIRELLCWFDRFIDGHANPKWLKSHAMELCYFIGTECLHSMPEKATRSAGLVLAPTPTAVPQGWKLVPVKLTEEMHVGAVRTIRRCHGNDDFPPRIYAAMLAAAPPAPVSAEPYGYVLEASDGHIVFFKDKPLFSPDFLLGSRTTVRELFTAAPLSDAKDAERYRHIRPSSFKRQLNVVAGNMELLNDDALDAAIDASIDQAAGIGQSVDKAPVHIDNTAIQVDRSTELQRNVADLWTTGKDWKK